MSAAIEVVEAGIATTLQDRGRPGCSHLGVSPSALVTGATIDSVTSAVGTGAIDASA